MFRVFGPIFGFLVIVCVGSVDFQPKRYLGGEFWAKTKNEKSRWLPPHAADPTVAGASLSGLGSEGLWPWTPWLLDTFFKAGDVAKKISNRGVKITIKPDKSPVTDGDLLVDKILRRKIKDLTPSIPIISEETVNLNIENKHNDFRLIDPIDGTKH